MAVWSNQTKNSSSFSNQSKNSATWDTPYKSGGGLIWNEATQTWDNTPETWDQVGLQSWSNQTKN